MNQPARRDGTPARKFRQGKPSPHSRRATPHQSSRSGQGKSAAPVKNQRAAQPSPRRPRPVEMVTPDHPVDIKPAQSLRQPSEMRLQKYLSQAGVASRRVAEELIASGRVAVDGVTVDQQGRKVDPSTAVVHVDGERVHLQQDYVYLVLNKPKGYLSTMSDENGRRPCVGDIISERVRSSQGLFHVGRLDADTEGLLLLTNDGELAHRLMHPSYALPKTYLATVRGLMKTKDVRALRQGVILDDGPVAVDDIQVVDRLDGRTLVRVVVHEGRNRIVRRMLAEVGFPVITLVRTHLGEVSLGNQRTGSLRKLNSKEIAGLFEAVEL